ncbi:hypothetical protein ACNYS0_20945 [Streptomyces sp. BH034]|uniref:hypothetical protein n=1 Tax=Streptomyces sp. BH034 TaxID=3402626 RepID=UPI003BB6501E
MPYDLGATVRLIAECRDPGGILATAATSAVTVTLPDGTTATPVTTEVSPLGTYQADLVTTVAGRHTVRWVFTGPAHAYTDSFDVREAAPPGLLSLEDGKEHLNIKSSRHDAEVREWIEATTRAVEVFTGPVVVRQVVEDHRVGAAAELALWQTPVVALTAVDSLATGGTAYAVEDLTLDAMTGVIARHDRGPLYGPLRVTYEAGRNIVPANITAAAKIILQHLWRTQQGPGRPQVGTGDFDVSEPIPGLGYAIPNRAVQLLEPDRLPPGVG